MPVSSKFTSELSPKFPILGFLYLQPMHGYDLHKNLELNLQEVWRISQSQTYNVLKNLEKDGWITATRQPQEKRPDRDILTLTELGKERFESWLNTPTPSSARAIRMEFITRLFFAAQISEDQRSKLVQEQVQSVLADLDGLHQRLAQIPAQQVYNRLGLELRIRQLTAIVAWIEDSLAHLVDGSN